MRIDESLPQPEATNWENDYHAGAEEALRVSGQKLGPRPGTGVGKGISRRPHGKNDPLVLGIGDC